MVAVLKADGVAEDAIGEKLKGVYKYKDIDLTTPTDESDCQKWFLETTGGRTVPRVYFDGECVGGASEVEDLRASGKLQEILEKILKREAGSEAK